MTAHKLVLWDIDGTLLYSGGVAGEAMRAAMTRVYGRPSDNELALLRWQNGSADHP
jgi:phosphoglycolate phosphatase-like HAD superfamily hydrolase